MYFYSLSSRFAGLVQQQVIAHTARMMDNSVQNDILAQWQAGGAYGYERRYGAIPEALAVISAVQQKQQKLNDN